MKLHNQQGFTLIEVLVATLVLTVGILGVAAMQMVSFQTNQSAFARSQAIYLAQDIFDRIRANAVGYQTTTVYDLIDTDTSSTIPDDPSCVTTTAGCTALQMAQQDAREWAQNFVNVDSVDDYRTTLPDGSGVLTRTGTTNEFTVVIGWMDRNWAASGSLYREASPRSVIIVVTLD